MAKELISVIVPVYGAEAYLNKCVNSIINQTYENLEIILVDDGSKDRSGAMCDEFAARDDRIRVIHKENGGLMSAWMAGVEISTGAYLCFVDSDDWIENEMISDMASYIRGKGEIICSNCLFEHDNGKLDPIYHGAAPGEYTGETLDKEIKKRILGNENRIITMSRCMKLTSRELITDNMVYCDKRVRMGEDMNIMLPAILDATRIYVMKDACYYHYYYNDESMAHGYDAGLNDNIEYLMDAVRKVFADKYDGPDAEELIEKENLFLFMFQIKNELKNSAPDTTGRILKLLSDYNIKARVMKTPLVVKNKVNHLLYLLMRHPGRFMAFVVETGFRFR
ncbi:glycosyltransferase family 2 protein [Butyrivibrio sp. AE3006]|uniref:glycosyltransferase family 2 protein n=1 Tax=Butyrivibrio sp. AE3006 TaxID=1280673 RepID=UPI0003F76669|nr:glycosyltransferase family 2 protein [Butyrivibrio sp. AE3006]